MTLGAQIKTLLMTKNTTPGPWLVEVESWSTAMQAARLSARTIELRAYHLCRLARAELAPTPWLLTPSDLLCWVGGHVWGRETGRSVRSSIRRFWAWGIETGRTDCNTAGVLPIIRPALPSPRPAEASVVAQALESSDCRVNLMLRLANELGMRRGEVAQVCPANDVVRDAAGWSLMVHGKGSRNRVLPLPADLADALRSAPPGYLFPSPRGSYLSPHWVGTLVSRALADGTTMHQLRHLCATEIHDQTHDVRLVQVLLGHSSLATTQRYIAVDDTKVREAINTRSVRWHAD
ncbi:MAG: integrase [Mycobacterium sp.]|jgi:integrase|nr:MAG: integrase [Mycobacterium sp.]